MTEFTIASFNVKNLIGPDQEYYKFESYTPEEYSWKQSWLAEQVMTLNADILCLQEVFEEAPLRDVIAEADADGLLANDANIPDASKKYARKAIFRKLAYAPYTDAAIAFAPNANDGAPGQRRPGVAIVSRFGFVEPPQVLQDLPEPLRIPFQGLDGAEAGHFEIGRLSRPILRARIPVGGRVVTVYNCHLKSKLGELDRPEGAAFPPAADLLNYDAMGRAMGAIRSGLRRMAEAWVLRQAIVADLQNGQPVIVLGDFNDSENAVSTEIITGEAPFKNYAWMRRHDARHKGDRYSDAENEKIQDSITSLQLHLAEKLFVRKSLRDMVYTSAFGGVFESIDQIMLSQHFHPDNTDRIGDMRYFTVLNDHLTDGSHPEAPYNKLASDHGQIMAHIALRD